MLDYRQYDSIVDHLTEGNKNEQVLSNHQQSFSTGLSAVVAQLPVYGFIILIVGFY